MPVHERAPVGAVSDLERFEQNDRALVETWAWDLALRHPSLHCDDFVIEGAPLLVGAASAIVFEVPRPLSVRVDRVLAQGLEVSRSRVRRAVVDPRQLKQRVSDGLVVVLKD